MSVFLAAVYARPALARRHEVGAWVASWLAAVALWTWVLVGVEGGTSFLLLTAGGGFVVATPCYLVWQAVALAVRQLLAWRAEPASA